MDIETLEKRQLFSIVDFKDAFGDKLTPEMRQLLHAKAINLLSVGNKSKEYPAPVTLVPNEHFSTGFSPNIGQAPPDDLFIDHSETNPAGVLKKQDEPLPVAEKKPLTDEFVMPFGKHKGMKLANIPNDYLIWLYDNGKCFPDLEVYIHDNLIKFR